MLDVNWPWWWHKEFQAVTVYWLDKTYHFWWPEQCLIQGIPKNSIINRIFTDWLKCSSPIVESVQSSFVGIIHPFSHIAGLYGRRGNYSLLFALLSHSCNEYVCSFCHTGTTNIANGIRSGSEPVSEDHRRCDAVFLVILDSIYGSARYF